MIRFILKYDKFDFKGQIGIEISYFFLFGFLSDFSSLACGIFFIIYQRNDLFISNKIFNV